MVDGRHALVEGILQQTSGDLARLAPPTAEMAELVAALAGHPAETRRFLGIIAGTVAIADFFAPESLGRIVGRRAAA